MKKIISLALLLASVYSMQAFLEDIANVVDQSVVAPIGRTLTGDEANTRAQRSNKWYDARSNNQRMDDRVDADNLSDRIASVLR